VPTYGEKLMIKHMPNFKAKKSTRQNFEVYYEFDAKWHGARCGNPPTASALSFKTTRLRKRFSERDKQSALASSPGPTKLGTLPITLREQAKPVIDILADLILGSHTALGFCLRAGHGAHQWR
jgi:hypothetical protein